MGNRPDVPARREETSPRSVQVFLTGGDVERAFFRHHTLRPGEAPCPLAPERGTSVEEVDARRFDGQPEGTSHAWAKERLATGLVEEPEVEAVFVETHLTCDGNWRQPDLLVRLTDGREGLCCARRLRGLTT